MNRSDLNGALSLAAGHATDRGPRPANEDFAAIVLDGRQGSGGAVAAIADGIGGARGGRVAAELSVRSFIDACAGQTDPRGVRTAAAAVIHAINNWVYTQGRMDAALDRMGCTLTGIVLRGRKVHALHVGDTRFYRLRDQSLAQLTEDHRPERSAMRNLLTRAIGAEETVRIDYLEENLEAHDRLLLCSDGVHDVLDHARIEAELNKRADPEETARRIVEAAVEGGGGDNATVLVIDVIDAPSIDISDAGEILAHLPIVPPPQKGAVIDGFILQDVLADGRYSRVFKAQDSISGAAVLVKFPKPLTLGAEASARGAFLRESWVASRVHSPWVGAVSEIPPSRRTCLYLVQPFYMGETLEQRLNRKPAVSLDLGLEVAQKLSKAVASLHRAGIIHRDIKPDNVILEADGGLKLVDLGVARLPHLEAWPLSENPGTPSYMAPELFSGATGDERTDIFALGVTLYRMLSGGAYPYGEIEPFSQPRFRRPTPLSAHRPELPPWLDDILARAFAPGPEERLQDAVELAFELEHGAIKGAPAHQRKLSLYEKNPIMVWQLLCLALVVALLFALAN